MNVVSQRSENMRAVDARYRIGQDVRTGTLTTAKGIKDQLGSFVSCPRSRLAASPIVLFNCRQSAYGIEHVNGRLH